MIDFDGMIRKHEEVRRKRRAYETLYEKTTDTSVKMSGMPHGGGSENQQEAKRIAYIAAKEDFDQAEAELKEMQQELKRAMKKLTVWQHRAVVQKRYMQGEKMEQVAMEIGYEIRQTNRFLSTAKEKINGF